MKISDAKIGNYVTLSKRAAMELRAAYGIGPFKIKKILKRTVHLEGDYAFSVSASQLSAFFEPCLLRWVA